jgi:hypothetical protein
MSIKHVKVERVIEYLENASPDTVNQLYDFGKILLDQIRALRESYDARLTSAFGWSTGLLAVMFIGDSRIADSEASRPWFLAAATTALLSLVAASIGRFSRSVWKWPSETTWFERDRMPWADSLKKSHVVSMLEAHQSYSERCIKKGNALTAAEVLLGVSGVAVGICILISRCL